MVLQKYCSIISDFNTENKIVQIKMIKSEKRRIFKRETLKIKIENKRKKLR